MGSNFNVLTDEYAEKALEAYQPDTDLNHIADHQ